MTAPKRTKSYVILFETIIGIGILLVLGELLVVFFPSAIGLAIGWALVLAVGALLVGVLRALTAVWDKMLGL